MNPKRFFPELESWNVFKVAEQLLTMTGSMEF